MNPPIVEPIKIPTQISEREGMKDLSLAQMSAAVISGLDPAMDLAGFEARRARCAAGGRRCISRRERPSVIRRTSHEFSPSRAQESQSLDDERDPRPAASGGAGR